jgi:hypothetical protein
MSRLHGQAPSLNGIRAALEVLDFDAWQVYEAFVQLAVVQGLDDLLARLHLKEQTPRPGIHLPYLCIEVAKNTPLAREKVGTLPNGKDDIKVLIETRGIGGQVVVAPTPPGIHPDCPERGYELLSGSWLDIPLITPDERHALWNCARALNRYTPDERSQRRQQTSITDQDLVGSDYNERVTQEEELHLLESHGWQHTYTRNDAYYLLRPGKSGRGWSATLGELGPKRFYVFSSSAQPFENDRSYDPFGVYTRLEHDGDFKSAAKALAEMGYGRNGQPSIHTHKAQDETYHRGANGDDHQDEAPTRPLIQLNTDMTGVVNKLQTAIRQLPKGPYLYQRAHQLSIIARGIKPPKWLRRPPDAPIIHPASPAYIRELAAYAADWEKFDERSQKWKATLPPPWTIDTLIARPWWTFPPLEGIICAPTLRPDGSILASPGYDADTGLYLSIDQDTFPPIPERPTIDNAREALYQLKEVYVDFPFSADHDKAAAVSAILSTVARFSVQGRVPLVAVRSTTRGSGKGLLIDTISMIATGRHAPRWPQTLDEEEERKRLLTVAMAGDPLIHIDNVTHPLGSAPLDMVLTAETITDRILGQHAQREAPLYAVFFASGNNMVFRGDMARRVLPIDLAPTMERPEERDTFAYTPLLDWVLKHRPQLVCAALTLLKAYFVAGSPKQQVKPFGSFEAWSTLIRQSLIWAGEHDPCEGRTNIEAESDPDYEQHHALLCAWYDRYSSTPKTVKAIKADIENHMVKDDDTERWIIAPAWRDLHEALIALDKRGRDIDVRAIGYALRSWQGRVVAGKQLVKLENDRLGIAVWCVQSL